jgi:hypothetical protein
MLLPIVLAVIAAKLLPEAGSSQFQSTFDKY